jgi:hypothetical protein
VTLSDSTPGATIYYTTNGRAPTTSSTPYTGTPIAVTATTIIEAIATANGYSTSGVATAQYTINTLTQAATPTFNPAAGNYTSAQTVTIADATSGASIYYTTDGSTPTTSSPVYSTPLQISVTTTVKAVAGGTGFTTSPVASATYTITTAENPTATPTLSPTPGTYTTAQSVTLADSTPGASIYYTINGTPATPGSTLYTGPIPIDTTTTLSVIAAANGYTNSQVVGGTYTIASAPPPTVATPTASPAPNTYSAPQSVTLADATAGASIYYTTDGTTPTTSSTLYSGAIPVASTTTIQAIAAVAGDTTSTVGVFAYTISLPAAATPTFSPAPGAYSTAQTVTISDTTAGATIYYTTDGTTPTTSSTVYSAPFQISEPTTVEAIATANDYSTSAVASATYTASKASGGKSGGGALDWELLTGLSLLLLWSRRRFAR